jgi:hypothetical protein
MQERRMKTTLKNQNNNNFLQPHGGGPSNENNNPDSQHDNKDDEVGGGTGMGSFLSKLERDIKYGIFQTMYLVVKDCDISTFKLSILLFIEFLQMIQYAFSSNVIDL